MPDHDDDDDDYNDLDQHHDDYDYDRNNDNHNHNQLFSEDICDIPVEHIVVHSSTGGGGGGSGMGHRRDDSDHWSCTSGLTAAHTAMDVSRLQTDESISDWMPETNHGTFSADHHPLTAVTAGRPDAESVSESPVDTARRVQNHALTLRAADGSTREAVYSGPLQPDDGTGVLQATGVGVLKFLSTGDMYMGDVVQGEMHGVGTYTCKAAASASPKRKSSSARAYKVLKGYFSHNVYTGWDNPNHDDTAIDKPDADHAVPR